ncbi:MAG: hypothetical protein LAT75_05365 [Candidatus Cyclonatronum sp.]|uniref:hypothetical protein n=1 Tax=Cyclonatronum sp. TaxID=3024185 RepID=UPI0025B9E2EB|nr:hypothetical protein [Cyclonatronum sp.]MCH8486273.1 hypothetical protein [Cyclonatronum sp.]
MNASPENKTPLLKRAEKLGTLVQAWVSGKTGDCVAAAQRTVDEGLFLQDDVRFALTHIRESVRPESLVGWSGKLPDHAEPLNVKPVLCLHAGNLPMVGLQDVLACIIAGLPYCGKLSRKDPHLMRSLLETLEEQLREAELSFSTEISFFSGLEAGAVLFSGSEKSVPGVFELLEASQIKLAGARKLIRTAHSSAAWIPAAAVSDRDQLGSQLAEAIFRYGGRGCRSLTTIFTDAEPVQLLHLIRQAAQAQFPNAATLTLNPQLRYREAFFRAMKRETEVFGGRLLAVTEPDPHTDGLLTITPGTLADLSAFLGKYGPRIQSVYVPDGAMRSEIAGKRSEPLSRAQTPPVHWQPDGTDALEWLMRL